MIDEELLNKFDRIQDLPVSEEMLGAYIEGNLSGNEAGNVELMIDFHPGLSELVDDISMPIAPYAAGYDIEILTLPFDFDLPATDVLPAIGYMGELTDNNIPDLTTGHDTQPFDTSFDNNNDSNFIQGGDNGLAYFGNNDFLDFNL